MNKVCILTLLLVSQVAFSQNPEWIPFQWHEETISGRRFEKAAMFVPVTIDGLPHKFVMQLDLGSDATMIYGNPVKPYLKAYPALAAKFDEKQKGSAQFKDVDLRIGAVSLGKQNMYYRKSFGNNVGKYALKEDAEVLIGTIGTDIFMDKVLVIDYPNKRICITSEIPKAYADATYHKYRLKYGKIILKLVSNGKDMDVMFDTGSSLFALATSEKNVADIGAQPNTDSFSIYSWGKRAMMYGREISTEVKLGATTLPPALVYYDTKGILENNNSSLGVWGVAGNLYFLNNVVTIDWKNNMFGVK